jgi:asparagine synthase (glutamine-hydrolysing)
MCGIAGIAAQGSAPCFREAGQAMVAALRHRGPDSARVECLGPCVLANTRLAIIDLSERGRQPMANEDGSVWITYNGEIYNAVELRELLLAKGYRFRSTSDTEVLLRLYEECGERAVRRLRGMFAFAIWDGHNRKLILGRDRLGIKPLYYALNSDRIIFASELKALLASGLVRPKLDPNGLRAFLQFGHVPSPWTALEEVKPLAPGHLAIWQEGELRLEEYWSLQPGAPATAAPPATETIPRVRELLLEAAKLHLVSDVPIVLFLSGGVDSACLAALAQRVGARDLTAVTLGFEPEPFDESVASRRTAEALRLPHRILKVPAKSLGDSLDHAIWAMDQPTMDGINSYVVCRVAAEAGYKVALTGQGADELFGGYTSLAMSRRMARLAALRHALPRKTLAEALSRSSLPYRWRKLAYLLETDDSFLAAQLAVKVLYPEAAVDDLLAPTVSAGNHQFSAAAYLAEQLKPVQPGGFDEKIGYLDFTTHLQPRLLRDMDAMSMAHSLEVRPVYLDHALVEFVLSIPAERRLERKRLLLAATKEVLPRSLYQDLTTRPKRTFTFPFEQWMGGELRGVMESALSASRIQEVGVLNSQAVSKIWREYCHSPAAVGWSRAWSLFVLQRWCEMMNVSW